MSRENESHNLASRHISLDGVSVSRGKLLILENVSLDVLPGQWVSLLGPNGAGKSTLLSMVGGLLPYSGSATLKGTEVSSMSARDVAKVIAVVRQTSPLLFDFSVRELVVLGLSSSRSVLKPFVKSDYDKVSHALESVDLAGFENRSVLELSGGERQRVFLAQALLQDPDVLILDEPTAHLDVHHQYAFLEMVQERVTNGLSVLSAFHDLEIAARYSDAIYVLDNGRIVSSGSPPEVLTPELVDRVFRMTARTGTSADGHLTIDFKSPS